MSGFIKWPQTGSKAKGPCLSQAMPVKKWSVERLRTESSYWRSCILIAAAHLDLFTWIANREERSTALAARFGGNPDGWELFLNALCAMGLLRKRGGKYCNTSFSSHYLGRGGATFLLPEYDAWKIWGRLASALVSGKRPNIQKPFFSDQQKAERLLRSLHIDGQKIAPDLIAKLRLGHSKTLLDLGGGLGAFSIEFCRRYPHMKVTLIEHPRIVSLARRAVRKAGVVKRVRIIGIDFAHEALPQGFDTVFVSNVIHSQGVDENRSLLLKIRNSLNPRGQLILRDVFMNRSRTAPEWAALFSVLLLLHAPHGRCYALDEVLAWLRQCGFSHISKPFGSSSFRFDPNSVLVATE